MEKRIVITGWSCVSPYGLSNEDFEKSHTSEIAYSIKEDWKKEGIGQQYFGEVPQFNIRKEIEGLRPPFPNRYSSLGLLGCLNALKSANLEDREDLLEKAGLIITTTLGASNAIQTFLEKLYTKGPDRLSPFVFSKATSNSILGDISRILKIKGPGSLVYGEDSITYGIDLILNDHSDLIICGGVDEITEPSVLVSKEMNRLLEPDEAGDAVESVKQSKEKDNYIFGEAASYIVLETLESARKRNATIYAEIVDYKQYMDSIYDKVIYNRSAEDLSRHLNEFVDQHTTSTEDKKLFVGSACLPWHIQSYEWEALGKNDHNWVYSNTKVSLGEGLSGTNNATVASAVLSLNNNKTANVFKDAEILNEPPSNITMDEQELENINFVVTNTFSLGGNNTLVALK
ncbi:MAG: hypothetical protein DWQ02_20825, partial [Bacteroidetes bacterium]